MTVRLKEVADAIGAVFAGDKETEARGITRDSREVQPGWVFVPIAGQKVDSHKFISEAMNRGAVGIISENPEPLEFMAAWMQVANARRALALASAAIMGHPSRHLALVGITGTNGKTTTAYLVASIAESAGEKAAVITTVEYGVGGERRRAERTTPEANEINGLLRRAVQQGCRAGVMECSSQAIDLHRCDGLEFRAAVFTNLTHDHLDYHGNMKQYFDVKKRLFDGRIGLVPRISVINADDHYGEQLAQLPELRGRVLQYGMGGNRDLSARNISSSLTGMRFTAQVQGHTIDFKSRLPGKANLYNCLAAIGTGIALGYHLDTVKMGIENCAPPPGRFEIVSHQRDFAVVVDYAHTEDALKVSLKTARELASGRIITVFGCGGDRDRSKRAPMGAVAGNLSDLVILTSDNPRNEDPEAIMDDVEGGLAPTPARFRRISDRQEAIQQALSEARSGDLVLIAGKGHEEYQIVGDRVFDFDDRRVAMAALS